MGAGKSTIGRLLAKELRLLFKDSDKEIELRTGANIPWIFDKEGEPGFRDREQAMIAELSVLDGVVLATGGGAVMREANRRALREGGRVIYLHASVEQQVGRTARDRNRPLLRTANPEATLRALLRSGAWELKHKPDVPREIVIDEYVELAKAFFDDAEAKFVNAALDGVARDARD